jgi:hypothetical protein
MNKGGGDSSIQRLVADGYKRPKKTYTDTLQSEEEILKKLQGYEEVEEENVDNIPIGSFIRYIKYDFNTDSERFVTGGELLRINPEYLLLKGKNNGSFCAQRYAKKGSKIIYKTRFFKLLSSQEKLESELKETQENAANLLAKYEDVIKEQQEEIEKLKRIIKKYSSSKRQ